jgi:peptidoglycan/LPS O-acetylase OafA/YrhL
MTYRPDIDGLRAMAVAVVIMFHAGFGFQGGYIGVDVFFVISGFLITGVISSGIDKGDFTYRAFWHRRIKRILPASTLVVVTSITAGYIVLLPLDLKDLAESAIAQQLMGSNGYFWVKTGYFDGPSDLKPLLHTWSLSVEEQFYLLFPFLLAGLLRLNKSLIVPIFTVASLGSLLLSQYWLANHAETSFYLLPSRAWELLTGSIVFFIPPMKNTGRRTLNIISASSVGCILTACFAFSADTPFPGFAALLPCLATCAFIYANSCGGNVVKDIFSHRLLVRVGLMSYSLYLWHWPILSFARYLTHAELPTHVATLALAGTFGAAFLSLKFLEQPIRRSPAGLTTTFLYAALAGLLVCSACWIIRSRDGVPERFSTEMQYIVRPIEPPRGLNRGISNIHSGKLPLLGGKDSAANVDFLVWGDSHAMAMGSLLSSVARDTGVVGRMASRTGTVPLVEVWRPIDDKAEPMDRWNAAVLEYIAKNRVGNVIMIARWSLAFDRHSGRDALLNFVGHDELDEATSKAAFEFGLERTLTQLRDLGVKVWICLQVPEQDTRPQQRVFRNLYYHGIFPRGVSRQQHHSYQFRASSSIREISAKFKMTTIVDLAEPFFDETGRSILGDSEGVFYRDEDHVSAHGAEILLRSKVEEILESIDK